MKTTIAINKTTQERLRELGKKGETYDNIIKKVLELAAKEEPEIRKVLDKKMLKNGD